MTIQFKNSPIEFQYKKKDVIVIIEKDIGECGKF